MLFGVRLSNEVYPPWKDDYIAYEKLKKLLKEGVVLEGDEEEVWTESDESRFVSFLDQELEKVYSFETAKYNELSDRITALENLIGEDSTNIQKKETLNGQQMEHEMEDILEIATQLDRFSRLNYTGFVKIVKKHDRLHPKYQVKPLLLVRLNALPFHNEDYSPLLYRLSSLYTFLSDNFSSSVANSASARMSSFHEDTDYQSFKFWIHPENVMEAKTKILRHLPVLVYGQEGKDDEDSEQSTDPTITSLYFDNPSFELYESELEKKKNEEATPSLRLRWYGKLQDRPDIMLERKDADSASIKLKEKHIDSFLKGEPTIINKTTKKMRDRNASEHEIEHYRNQVQNIQNFIKDHRVSPVLRTVYTRTAFQIPGDDRIRVILDSDIQFIREDCFNTDRPIRDPESWKRADLDLEGIDNDLRHIRKSEYTKFPYSVLELRLKTKSNGSGSIRNTRHAAWVEDLISSHLVKEVPQFSKFVQGIASLFAEDDRLDALPFWLPDLEHDIRQDPKDVYKRQRERVQLYNDESQRRASLTTNESSASYSSSGILPNKQQQQQQQQNQQIVYEDDDSSDDGTGVSRRRRSRIGYPSWEPSGAPKLDMDSEDEEVVLPPGVDKPTSWLRHQGSIKVETKVWLANERTFNKWLSVTTLLAVMTFGLFNSVRQTISISLAEYMSYILFALTMFTGIWGYSIYMKRLRCIEKRSEQHLDASFGPLVVAVTLFLLLTANFYFTMVNSLKIGRGLPGRTNPW